MQEALQNPHFKKIWEKINWPIRHPEAENLNLALGSEYLQYQKECITITSQDGVIKEILGRPITLEDIMLLLPKDFAFLNLHNSFVKIDAHNSYQPVTGYNTHWQLTKPLHEQTPETWEKISNLI